jgi:hypothetical protein
MLEVKVVDLDVVCTFARSYILIAVKTSVLVFRVVATCGLVGRYQFFRGTYCLHFLGCPEMKAVLSL